MQAESLHSHQPEQHVPQTVEYELHHSQATVDLRYGTPLMSRADVLKEHGRDGDLVAMISLPGEDRGQDKQIGVIDYGEPDPANPRWVLAIDDGDTPIKMLGRVKARYGLVTLNYGMSRDPRRAFVDVPEGEVVKLGRQEDSRDTIRAGYHLGLDDKNSGNKAISRSHATLQIQDGQLTVIDHSANGTKVKSAA